MTTMRYDARQGDEELPSRSAHSVPAAIRDPRLVHEFDASPGMSTGNSNIKQFAYSDYSERLYMAG